MLKGSLVGSGRSIRIMQEWYRGWDKENLNYPLRKYTTEEIVDRLRELHKNYEIYKDEYNKNRIQREITSYEIELETNRGFTREQTKRIAEEAVYFNTGNHGKMEWTTRNDEEKSSSPTERYDVIDVNGKIILENQTKEQIIDYADVSSHYEQKDYDEGPITDFENARRWIEHAGDERVVKKSANPTGNNPKDKKSHILSRVKEYIPMIRKILRDAEVETINDIPVKNIISGIESGANMGDIDRVSTLITELLDNTAIMNEKYIYQDLQIFNRILMGEENLMANPEEKVEYTVWKRLPYGEYEYVTKETLYSLKYLSEKYPRDKYIIRNIHGEEVGLSGNPTNNSNFTQGDIVILRDDPFKIEYDYRGEQYEKAVLYNPKSGIQMSVDMKKLMRK